MLKDNQNSVWQLSFLIDYFLEKTVSLFAHMHTHHTESYRGLFYTVFILVKTDRECFVFLWVKNSAHILSYFDVCVVFQEKKNIYDL